MINDILAWPGAFYGRKAVQNGNIITSYYFHNYFADHKFLGRYEVEQAI